MIHPTMIDLETLGTNVNSQILSIGACTFNAGGEILRKFYEVIELNPNVDERHMNVTSGTLGFWLSQSEEARKAIWDHPTKVSLMVALNGLSKWLEDGTDVWANGTKFDIAAIEYRCKENGIQVPFIYNADRCMRTLRKFAGHIDVDYKGIPHHALDDAIWQAKYVAAACRKLNLDLYKGQ